MMNDGEGIMIPAGTKRGRKEQVFVPKQRGGLVKTCSFAISSKMSLKIVFDYSKII